MPADGALEGKVLAGYLRLTVDRHGNKLGYERQKKEISAWAESRGCTIGHWYQDKDLTAADLKVKRADYEAMLKDVQAGKWDGIAVWRLDRLVRLTREFERCFAIVDDAKGVIVSTSDDFSTLTTVGRITMRIMVMVAEMEIDGMKARNKLYQQARAEDGHYGGGGPRPFGFVGAIRDENDRYQNVGRVGVDHVEDEVVLIREAAKSIIDDKKSWRDVARDWNTRTPPVLGTTGKPWNPYTLQRVMCGPRIVGLREVQVVPADGGEPRTELRKAVWDAILDMETWEKLKSTLNPYGKRGRKQAYLLSGLLACGRCGRPLTGAKRKYQKGGVETATNTYRCKSGPSDEAKGSCGKLSVLADDVEKVVVTAVLRRIAETPEMFHGLDEDSGEAADLAELWEELAECDEKLADLSRERNRRGGISKGEWQAGREVIMADRAEITRQIEALSRRSNVPVPKSALPGELVNWFENDLSLDQRRKLLTMFVDSVSVAPAGRSGRYFNSDRVVLELSGAK